MTSAMQVSLVICLVADIMIYMTVLFRNLCLKHSLT